MSEAKFYHQWFGKKILTQTKSPIPPPPPSKVKWTAPYLGFLKALFQFLWLGVSRGSHSLDLRASLAPSALTQSTCSEFQRCYFPLYSGECFNSRTPWMTFVQDLVIISSIDIDTDSILGKAAISMLRREGCPLWSNGQPGVRQVLEWRIYSPD